jgi:hypothetical protein
MSRAAYCRRQARLCRAMAHQMSASESAMRLVRMARGYDDEADRLETTQTLPEAQKSPQDGGTT